MLDTNSNLVFLKGEKDSPRLILDANRKIIDIKGRSIVEEIQFYNNIKEWISNNSLSLQNDLNISVYMEYFNTITAKGLLEVFKKAEEIFMKSDSKKIKVNWLYEIDDEDMQEAGEDYESVLRLPFNVVQSKKIIEDDDTYYQDIINNDETQNIQSFILDINTELIEYIAKHPTALYDISSRKFEELIADILKDFGFDIELTKMTRDGGRDIIAHIKNSLTSLLIFVECKHYAPHRPVGVDIIREVLGVRELYKPNKSMIITSSYFTKDAIKERSIIESQLELKDYNNIKEWLQRYT
jgi:HJR/Mrr/RecB family endonuclease